MYIVGVIRHPKLCICLFGSKIDQVNFLYFFIYKYSTFTRPDTSYLKGQWHFSLAKGTSKVICICNGLANLLNTGIFKSLNNKQVHVGKVH